MNGTTEKELIAYNQESLDVLEKLKAELPEIPEFDYFFDLAQTYHSIEAIREIRPEILVLGTEVPEELVLAPGKRVHWILGGSPKAGTWAGELAPRDTDPVSRSMLGFLENEWGCLPEDALILIPIVNDSRRKIAYLLRRAGRKVHTIDVPPVKGAWAYRQWQRQWELCAEVLSAHTGRRITPKRIRQISEQTGFCSLQMKRLLQLPNLSDWLTGPCPKNETLFSHVTEAAISKSIDGVVYQVLKGQIGHDFELERYEEFFAAQNIPVFRLETDYNYQDVEQLRIRLEAFREMLEQRDYKDRQ